MTRPSSGDLQKKSCFIRGGGLYDSNNRERNIQLAHMYGVQDGIDLVFLDMGQEAQESLRKLHVASWHARIAAVRRFARAFMGKQGLFRMGRAVKSQMPDDAIDRYGPLDPSACAAHEVRALADALCPWEIRDWKDEPEAASAAAEQMGRQRERSQRMSVEDARQKLEEYTQKNGWPGSNNKAAELIGCSPHTVKAAVHRSVSLMKAKEDAEAGPAGSNLLDHLLQQPDLTPQEKERLHEPTTAKSLRGMSVRGLAEEAIKDLVHNARQRIQNPEADRD